MLLTGPTTGSYTAGINKDKNMAKNNSSIWFRKVRGSYLPNSVIGLGVYLLYVAYIVVVGVEWYRLGHSGWVLLTTVVPVVVVAAFITQAIASKHSK